MRTRSNRRPSAAFEADIQFSNGRFRTHSLADLALGGLPLAKEFRQTKWTLREVNLQNSEANVGICGKGEPLNGAVARILHYRKWRTRLVGLAIVFAGITIDVGGDQNAANRIVLPIEVLGENGTTVSSMVILETQHADLVHSLWLRTNGLRYRGQGSVQVNDGTWMPFQNEDVAVDEPGKSYGGIGGGFATLGMRIPLPHGAAVSGPNIIRFRFNHTDGVSSGYRVLAWNFLTADGAKIIPAQEFCEDDPDSWGSPLTDKRSIQGGLELWRNAELTQSSEPNSPKIRAHCADCHTYDGRDLKYFNFSNHSIVTRSRFHGLSALQGQQIASYIRSLPFPNPGRPWNPPYQPGPGLDERPVANWAAGAGIDWVLEQDAAALPQLVSQSSASKKSPSAATSQAVEANQLLSQITPELFRPDGDLSTRQIPIALQLPDWNEWLPRVHPKDAWGATFTQSEFGRLYWDGLFPAGNRDGEKSPLRAALAASPSGYKNLHSVASAFDRWSRARRAFLKNFVKSGTVWTPSLTDKVYSTELWQLVKTWEMTQEFGLEGRGRELYGPGADSRTWFNIVPLETAPSAAQIPDGPTGVGGSALTNAYFNAAWYELQILLNSGSHQHDDRRPIDWVYLVGWFQGLYAQTHQPEPVRLLVAIIKSQQWADSRLGPDNFRRGWQPNRNLDPRIMVSPGWAALFKPLSAEVHRALTTAFLSAWMGKTLQYPISEYLPIGLRTENYSYQTYGDITGGEVWTAAAQFRQAGVPNDLIDRLQQWGSVYADRAARLQYEGRSHGKM